jgi:serine/threonine protein kinase
MDHHTLPLNFQLNNKYRIKKVLGQGGFGITYLAEDSLLDIEVCVKELFISGSSTRGTNMTVMTQNLKEFSFADFKDRFLQEAKQLARFGHPNIVRVMEFFEANNTAYVVMEYIAGKNLKDYIAENGIMTEQQALPIIHQLFDAVEEVHNAGMLHRDLKPDNILLTAKNRVVLIDFGSAREFTEGKTITQTAMLTPGFAPIEQYSNRAKRGTFTDIYALGATMYFMLTGHKPIAATDRYREQLAAPHQRNPQISTQLSSAVMMAMEMKEEDRFQSVVDFRLALKQYLSQTVIVGHSNNTQIENNQKNNLHVSIENKLSKKPDGKWIAITGTLCFFCCVLTYLFVPSSQSVSETSFLLEKGFKHTNEIVDLGVKETIKSMEETVISKPHLKPLHEAAKTVPDKIKRITSLINDLRNEITDASGGLYTVREHKSKWEKYGHKKFTVIEDKGLDGIPVGRNNSSKVYRIMIYEGKGEKLKAEIIKTHNELIAVIEDLVKTADTIDGVKFDNQQIENLKKELILVNPEGEDWSKSMFGNLSVSSFYPLLRKFENDANNSAAQIVNFIANNFGN